MSGPDEGHPRDTIPVTHVERRDEASIEGVPLLDLRGLNCPLPALKAGRRLRDAATGARLWIETTDPLATIDIPAMAREQGHALVTAHAVEGGHRFLVEAGSGAERPT